jgi:hypothetical protein
MGYKNFIRWMFGNAAQEVASLGMKRLIGYKFYILPINFEFIVIFPLEGKYLMHINDNL